MKRVLILRLLCRKHGEIRAMIFARPVGHERCPARHSLVEVMILGWGRTSRVAESWCRSGGDWRERRLARGRTLEKYPTCGGKAASGVGLQGLCAKTP